MELFSAPWWSALLAIVLIDLVLAGDNAIVIALAARSLPAHLQKRAIVWGTVGAVVVRSTMTIGVVWLLKIPGLMLVGGLGLVWIAYKLLVPSEGGDEHAPQASTFWGAMKTIIVADALMGVDNVLGVAGAAQGSFLLVVLGLLISVPIMIWGSTLVLRLVDRHPWIVTAGAGVLIWTAVQMILDEPVLAPWLPAHSWFDELSGAVLTAAILGAWLLRLRQRRRAAEVDGERLFALKFTEGRNMEWLDKVFLARYDARQNTVDKLEPLGGGEFFYREELQQIEAALRDSLAAAR